MSLPFPRFPRPPLHLHDTDITVAVERGSWTKVDFFGIDLFIHEPFQTPSTKSPFTSDSVRSTTCVYVQKPCGIFFNDAHSEKSSFSLNKKFLRLTPMTCRLENEKRCLAIDSEVGTTKRMSCWVSFANWSSSSNGRNLSTSMRLRVLLCLIDSRVRRIKNKASSRLDIFFRPFWVY